MGHEHRNWRRTRSTAGSGRRLWPAALAAAGAGLVLGVGAMFGLSSLRADGNRTVAPPPPRYAHDDPWRPYLAPETSCPGGDDQTRSVTAQADTMVCLINYARSHAGLDSLSVSSTLSGSARLKGDEILRCDRFAHSPCGDDPSAGVRGLGYAGAFGENLYIADGRDGAPRVALDHWLNSPDHRENLFRPQWRVQSLYVAKVATFRQYRGATLWVSQFGSQ